SSYDQAPLLCAAPATAGSASQPPTHMPAPAMSSEGSRPLPVPVTAPGNAVDEGWPAAPPPGPPATSPLAPLARVHEQRLVITTVRVGHTVGYGLANPDLTAPAGDPGPEVRP